MNKALILITSLGLLGGCSSTPTHLDAEQKVMDAKKTKSIQAHHLIRDGEYHFSDLKQLTFGGKNIEASFNGQGTELIFQAVRDGFQCPQTFRMDTEGKNSRLASTGLGQTKTGYLFPQSPKLIFSSTQKTRKYCAPPIGGRDVEGLDYWHLLPHLDIYVSDDNGNNPTLLSPQSGYDSEAVVSPSGDAILFTSTRGGDVDIWIMDPDGTNARQLTHEIGYDGGASFNSDGSKIVYRANHPNEKESTETYQTLLKDDLVRPESLDLYVMNRDGSDKTNILANGATNFAPFFHPDGKRIIFSSNIDAQKGGNADLYIINIDGSGLERITYGENLDAFAMFSNDGKHLVFSSNRGSKKESEINIFLAEWTDTKPQQISLPEDSQSLWLEHAKILSAKEMEGRGLGTKGLKLAETYIVNQLNKLGYEAELQSFLVDVAVSVERSIFKIKKGSTTYIPTTKDLVPYSFSGDGAIDGEVIFVGHGTQTKGWDDYKNLDVEGKTVVVFSRGHGEKYVAINAQHHGAKAIVFINPPSIKKDIVAEFELTRGRVQIPALNMTWSFANKVFDDLKPVNDGARKRGNRQSLGECFIQIETKIKRRGTKAQNVVATLKGISGKNVGSIVVGAHFDHLGLGGDGSLSPDEKAIHPGADDNASGVATVLEIARQLKSNSTKFKRDITFVLFSGEESGLLGSQHFVSDPTNMKNVGFMLNFDMIGRMKNKRVNLMGTGTAVELIHKIRRAQVNLDIEIEMSEDGFGPSDQSSFYAKRVPVLHFFTGLHEDYHRPSDTFEKLNVHGAQKIGTLALRIITELADQKDIHFIEVQAREERPEGLKSAGAFFGSIPSFKDQPENGVLLSGARPGSPADKAGIKAGDVIVRFGKYEVRSMNEYAFALRKHQDGDKVAVVIERGGIQIKLKATLSTKKQTSPQKNQHK